MRFGNPPASQRAIADVMEQMQQHIDWEYIRSLPIKDSWNVQCGALCCWVDAKFHEHQGHIKELIDIVLACIQLMQMWHKHRRHNAALETFKDKLLTDGPIASKANSPYWLWQSQFLESCKTFEGMKMLKCGLAG